MEIDGEAEEYAFDLNEFFITNGSGRFAHEEAVDRFLDALTTQEKFPFSTPELRDELRHTFWLLNRVDSARALMKKLQQHPVFKKYEIVLAAGDGRLDADDQMENQKSFDRVQKAIRENEYTITLSVGQLTTGVTIPEWTAVLMLSSIRSPALYMQAAFRAQNPCLFQRDGQYFQKQNAYVFDFDPARTLIIFERFANDLSTNTADGRGDMEQRKQNVRTLLNFFPVIGEDEDGEMIALDAEKVLSIPRRIKSREVVKSGFMNNYLFTDAIGIIFHAPQEVIDIITSFTPVEEPGNRANITPETAEELSINDEGEVELDREYVIGTAAELFGEKIFAGASEALDAAMSSAEPEDRADTIKRALKDAAVNHILDAAQTAYGGDMRPSSKRALEKQLGDEIGRAVDKAVKHHEITEHRLKQEREDMLGMATTDADRQHANEQFEAQMRQAEEALSQTLHDTVHDIIASGQQTVVNTVETDKKEREKKAVEDRIKDHLRGFSRTIPSFLMAYGDETVTLATFDQVIPAHVFQEVTSISLESFRMLRDGGDYVDEVTGEMKHYPSLFDPVVFDDSVRLFLQKRSELADYFEADSTEDIFDYIPPQKTNQIFTPKRVVRQMVDLLEAENPGCFDRDDVTFADLYMKSGLYVAEIVKRLYQSEAMKAKYPDREARLKHIFAQQVYGLAPTEIIYRIATRFVLGFSEDLEISQHHLRQLDALEYAKEGTLQGKLDEVFR